MDLSQSASRPRGSKRDESQSQCSGHCCSIDYQWKMSDSLSQVSLSRSLAPPRHTQALGWIILCSEFELIRRPVVNVYAQAVKRTRLTILYRACSEHHFHFPVEVCFSRWGRLLNVTESLIAQTLNVKASRGIYWSPDPGLLSLNWFMDPISGARAAGVHVGASTRRTGHPSRWSGTVSSAAPPPPPPLTRPLHMLLAYRPAWPGARLHGDTCTRGQHVHTKTRIHPAAVSVSTGRHSG